MGYEIHEFDDGPTVAAHQQRFNLFIFEQDVGAFFISVFNVNSEGKRHRLSFLESMNAFNEKALACQCYVNQADEIIMRAFCRTDYDRMSFGQFIDLLNDDHNFVFDEDVNLAYYSG